MNNNLEFENEDPSPDSLEDNHPRTNYGAGYSSKEILVATKRLHLNSASVPQPGSKKYFDQDFSGQE